MAPNLAGSERNSNRNFVRQLLNGRKKSAKADRHRPVRMMAGLINNQTTLATLFEQLADKLTQLTQGAC
jgi:hypothetical protein